MFLILLAVLSAIFVYFFGIRPFTYWKDRGVKQCKVAPFFGNNLGSFLRKESMAEMVKRCYDAYPGIRYSGIYQFSIPTLILRDPDLIKQITVKDFDHFVDHRQFIPTDIDPLWGKNLFSLTGQKWREMRATLSPSFTSSKMRFMFNLMSEAGEDFIRYFQKQEEEVITIELKDVFTRYANDVIATCAFGIKVDSLAEKDNEFYRMGKEATDFTSLYKVLKFFLYLICPYIGKILSMQLFSKEVSSFFRGLIKTNIKERETKGIVRNDMINLLMEARRGTEKLEENNGTIDTGFATVEESEVGQVKIQKRDITDDDITAQALIFFFAGFDSVSSLLCFMGYELAVNQDIQDKIRDEMYESLKENGGKLTYESILKMKYLDMVISETLRKWPVGVAMDRVCTKPYTIEPAHPDEKPVHLTINDVVWLPIYGLHRDPEYYPNPEKFDPERFNDENKGNINPYAYVPFGSGPRNCIGSRFAILETKAVMFHILTNFKIIPVEKSVIPLVISKKSFNLSSENGFWFGFQKMVK